MSSAFDASPSFQGFNYQLRLALLLAVRKARFSPGQLLSLEVLDDVAIVGQGEATLLQAKHTAGVINDWSPELWKTIRVWAEGIRGGQITATDSMLVLMTTSSVQDSCAASRLLPSNRDESEALQLLDHVAATSTNQALSAAFNAYSILTVQQRRDLVASITVLSEQSDVVQLRNNLAYELRYATSKDRLDLLIKRFEGWWFDLAVRHLAPDNRHPVPLYAFDAEVDRLRAEYSEFNLPIEFEYTQPDADTVGSFYERTFVAQLRLLGFDKQLIHAIHDYYRAAEQRSKWVKDSLLYLDDLTDYESRLKEEWRRQYDWMCDELGQEATEQQMTQSGRALVKWMNDTADFRVVPDCHARFVMRGSYHVLADRLEIGWHPKFADRLAHLLAGVTS